MNKTPELNSETLGRGRRKKWDMDRIEQLFMGGAEMSDILRLPEFSKMSRFYLKNCMVKGKWIDKRKKLRESVANIVTVRWLTEVHDVVDGPRSVDFAHLRLREERTAVRVLECGRSWLEADDHGGRVQHHDADAQHQPALLCPGRLA